MSTQTAAPALVTLNANPEGDGLPSPGGYLYTHRRPALTTDAVVFTIREGRLCLLLVRRGRAPQAGSWALPGGYSDMAESIDDTVSRELEEETGITGVWFEQLKTFDRPQRVDESGRVVVPGRDPRGRSITVAYFALISSDVPMKPGDDAHEVAWHSVDSLPPLAFDHHEIMDYAVWRLRNKIEYSSVGFQLLPAQFTLPQLQGVYEAVLGEAIDRRNFRRKVLDSGVVQPTGACSRQGRGRPAALYRYTDRPFGLRAWK